MTTKQLWQSFKDHMIYEGNKCYITKSHWRFQAQSLWMIIEEDVGTLLVFMMWILQMKSSKCKLLLMTSQMINTKWWVRIQEDFGYDDHFRICANNMRIVVSGCSCTREKEFLSGLIYRNRAFLCQAENKNKQQINKQNPQQWWDFIVEDTCSA